MHRRFLPLIVVAATAVADVGCADAQSAIGIMAAIHNCQSTNVAPEARIEACSQAIHTNLASHGILAALYNNRGVAYEAARDIDHARQDYDKALALKPDFAEAQANRARLFGHLPANTTPAPADVK